jgi:PAS domain S-box-containing protein
MLKVSSLDVSGRLLLGYGVAILTVAAALISLLLLEGHWRLSVPVSALLLAVIISTWFGGVRPGLLSMALAILSFDYFLLHVSGPLAREPIEAIRLVSLATVASYLVWITATEASATQSLRRAHDELQRNNQALQAENLQRRRTEEELRVSEAKFRALSQNAPSAIFIFQEEKITYANPVGSAITGYSGEALTGMSFRDILHPDYRELMSAVWRPPEPGEPVPLRHEVKIVTKSGNQLWVDSTKARFELEGEPAVVCIASDITDRKRAEDALRDSQQLLQQVLATLPVGVGVTNRAGDILLVNAAMRDLWGEPLLVSGAERWARTRAWWHDSRRRITPGEWGSVRAISAGETGLNELIDIEAPTGEKTIQNSFAPVRNTEGEIVGAVFVNEDVTERVRADAARQESARRLRHLSRRLLTVQEEERRHLSRELHDEFGQLLATITLHLHAARASAGETARASLDEAIAVLQRAGAHVRNLVLELRPTMLDTAGLGTTLRWLAEQHQQRTGIAIQVAGEESDASGDLAIACFRVVQEALTNVVRHARARQVWIELSQHEGRLELVVRDDGVGFDVARTLEHAVSGSHLGLLGMKERVELLGGSLEVDSRPGHGTRLYISLPMTETVAESAQRSA